ncbi:T9SS type A sorting domain-containing protein, partial [Flavobacteriales bacterium]|nr:T9SS type A sorting domain-containing protein [Flavobacteriales bacterium]
KKIFTLSTALILVGSVFSQGTSFSFCENFDSYQSGDPIAQTSPSWNTWGELMNGTTAPFTDDANISSTLSLSGNNSLYLFSGATQGLQDIILPFGSGAPYTTGTFEFVSNFYVNTSTGAYFNFQADNIPGSTWSLDVKMDFGTIVLENTGSGLNYLTASYPEGVWFELKIIANLTTNNWELFIDNQSLGSFTNNINQIASLDLYPIIGHQFYVDDLCYTYTPFIPLAYDMAAIDLNMVSNLALTSTPFTISGDIVSISATTITSLDVNYSINGAPPIVDYLSGLNLSIFDTLTFNHNIIWNPTTTGSYFVEIWASNLNGNTDMDSLNDYFSDSIHIWNALAVKQPLIETFTSSTCGPCNPANVTAEALFAQNPGKITSIKYQADWPGLGDPYYTDEVGNRIAYYGINSVPRMEIDGGWDQNGNNITQQIVDDYINELCLINLSSVYSITGKTVDVDITLDPLENFNSNNLVIHSAIIEETTYNNIKNNGETQFEHVVKKMVPSDNGTPVNNLVAGQQLTLNIQHIFQGNYRLPFDASSPINHTIEHSVEDFSNLMVAVWIQDIATKEIHQSTYATLSTFTPISFDCINNTCIDPATGNGQYTSLANCQSSCNSTSIEENSKIIQFIYPNPATDKIFISNLKENNTIVKVYDINGRLVLENKISNEEYLNISILSKGIYQIKFEGIHWNETRKLIIE